MKIKNKSTKFNLSCCHFKMDGKEYENIYNFVNGDYKVYPTEFSEITIIEENIPTTPTIKRIRKTKSFEYY